MTTPSEYMGFTEADLVEAVEGDPDIVSEWAKWVLADRSYVSAEEIARACYASYVGQIDGRSY